MLAMLTLVVAAAQPAASDSFDRHFENRTLRLDYFRVGCRTFDTLRLHRWVEKASVWAGSTTQLVDPIDNGNYRVEMRDASDSTVLYTRCFNTLFREDRDTPAGADSVAEFEEVLLLPWPRQRVEVSLQRRDSNLLFRTQKTFTFDPATTRTVQPRNLRYGMPRQLQYKGDPHVKMDVVIVAEGYGPKDQKKMEKDLKAFTEHLFAREPFRSRRDDFNVWGVARTSDASGITDPVHGIEVNSIVGSTYNIFGSDRYLMTYRLFLLHDLLHNVPCDHIVIMANSATYGGGAIYNFYAMSAVQEMSEWILPHELGHSIGGLADEYVDDELTYNNLYQTGVEPIEPNITSLADFDRKWQSLLPEGTPVPTPPVESLPRRETGPVGVYEGAGYVPTGIYRPTTHCMMRDYARFCPVCIRRLNEVFDLYVR